MLYNFASTKEPESLESVSNEAMRISGGCFKSTPVSRLHITEQPPLQIMRDELSLKYYYKVKHLLQNPAFKFILSEQETLYVNEISPPRIRNQNPKNTHKI